ncbi:unnamed protein product [Heterobilharzia americana]|nr:unnamed protein product [Heterobilharzia americana]
MSHLKLVVLGPNESGKSYICNFLSETVDQITGDYYPTSGVRILEYEQKLKVKGKPVKIEVELWDVSGDRKYEACWPAIFKGAHGVVFVYNPDKSHHEEELNEWYQTFPQSLGLKDQQFCVICYKKPDSSDKDIVSLPSVFHRFFQFRCNMPKDGEKLREQFGKFVSQIAWGRLEASEQEELNIMNS